MKNKVLIDAEKAAAECQQELLNVMKRSINIVSVILEDEKEKSETRLTAAVTIVKMSSAVSDIAENIRKAKEDEFFL